MLVKFRGEDVPFTTLIALYLHGSCNEELAHLQISRSQLQKAASSGLRHKAQQAVDA